MTTGWLLFNKLLEKDQIRKNENVLNSLFKNRIK